MGKIDTCMPIGSLYMKSHEDHNRNVDFKGIIESKIHIDRRSNGVLR